MHDRSTPTGTSRASRWRCLLACRRSGRPAGWLARRRGWYAVALGRRTPAARSNLSDRGCRRVAGGVPDAPVVSHLCAEEVPPGKLVVILVESWVDVGALIVRERKHELLARPVSRLALITGLVHQAENAAGGRACNSPPPPSGGMKDTPPFPPKRACMITNPQVSARFMGMIGAAVSVNSMRSVRSSCVRMLCDCAV